MSNVSEAATQPPATNSIATEVFTPRAAAHAAEAMRNHLGKLWLPLALPVVALVLAGLTDWRWFIVAAALLFTVYPFAVIAGWFGAMASRSAVMAVYPQQITLTQDRTLTVSYRSLPQADDTGRDTQPHAPTPIVIPVGLLSGCELRNNRIYLRLSQDAPLSRLIIPVSAFRCIDDCRMFYHTLTGSFNTGDTKEWAF